MELRELRTFEAIVEEGSFRLAADRLNQTPSALSHQIGRLEPVLGHQAAQSRSATGAPQASLREP